MKSIYRCMEPVHTRIAFGSIDDYHEMLHQEQDADSDGVFKESILAASFDLYESMSRKHDKKKYDELQRSLMKYNIRRMARCTPYGLFSGVGIVKFAENTKLSFSFKDIKKRTRVDMKWLYGYISQVLMRKEVIEKLYVKRNRLCYVNGDRLINPYFSAGGNSSQAQNSVLTIRYTRVVEFVFSQCKDYILCSELLSKLEKVFQVSREKARKFLDGLIQNEFLQVEIYPPVINTDPVYYVIEKLKKAGVYEDAENLENIQKEIIRYDSLSIGEGVNQYLNVRNAMEKLHKEKDYLQTDCKVDLKECEISYKVVEEIEKTVNMLAALAAGYKEQKYLSEYKEDFLEKYGYDTEVPLLEMLDYNLGIGVPANYQNSKKSFVAFETQNQYLDTFNAILLNKAFEAVKRGESVIKILDEDIEYLMREASLDETKLLNSFDVFAQIIADNTKKIDDGMFEIVLSGCIASAGGLNTLGRFSDLFWEKNRYDAKLLEREKRLLGDKYIIAELVEQFNAGRIANVDMNRNSLDYQICIGCQGCSGKTVIEIDDIYVGVDSRSNQFYAKSYRLNKRIYARTTHMLSNFIGSSAYRFLRDISSLGTKFQFGETVTHIGDSNLEYVPRIMYGKTILQPAQWRIDDGQLSGESFEVWERRFFAWKKKHKLPDYVDYSTGDNFLTLDLRKKECRELLYYNSKNAKRILLLENYFVGKKTWLKDSEKNSHCSEFVFPCIRLSEEDFGQRIGEKEELKKEKCLFHEEDARVLFPGERGWYYYKLYGMSDRKEEFIGIDMVDLIEELGSDLIQKHFFIRYQDSREHVRLRFQVMKGQDERFIRKIHAWMMQERSRGMISKVCMDVYERELERYGGKDLIEPAEAFFCEDSRFVENIIRAEYAGELDWSKECIAIWGIKGLLDSFGFDLERAEAWMSENVKQTESRKLFRKNEAKYRKSLFIAENEIQKDVFLAYQNRSRAAENYFQRIQYVKNHGTIANTANEILSVLIHMFCNRYMANNVWEKEVRALTRHSLHAELGYRKHCM